jgi:predicted transcriptional regulator
MRRNLQEENAVRKFAKMLIAQGFSISQIAETLELSPALLSFLENVLSKKNNFTENDN